MQRPPLGLSLRVTYVKTRDGDTVEVKVQGSAFIFAIRLLDCWCPPKNTPEGARATKFVEQTLEQSDPADLSVYIPSLDTPHLLKHFTFDRVLAHLFIEDNLTLGELLVDKKLASRTKGGNLGE